MVARGSSRARFTPFVCGAIYGLALAGWTYQQIADEVKKSDGSHPCQQSVASVVKRAKQNGELHKKEVKPASTATSAGRPRRTTTALDRAIVKLVFKHRGRTLVTTSYVQKVIKAARKVSRRTITRRLGEAGLAWLRRRRKSLVPEAHKAGRGRF